MKKIGIIGCGWLGLRMAAYLQPTYEIYATTRTPDKVTALNDLGYNAQRVDFGDDSNSIVATWSVLNKLDAIVVTVPFSKRIEIDVLQRCFEGIGRFIKGYTKQLFLMSSVGIYPDVAMQIGESTFEDGLLNPNLLCVEQLMRRNFPQVNILRLGGLMGDNRIFSNYKIPSATLNRSVNHVHFQDVSRAVEKLIQKKIHSTTYNIVAPLHPTKQEVINHQKETEQSWSPPEKSREITSQRSERELGFSYEYPDPRLF